MGNMNWKNNRLQSTNKYMKIIIGLGNPGKKYEKTRHNVGWFVLDKIAEEHGLVWTENKKFNALICEYANLILVKPLTFMNNSGEAAAKLMNYYNLLPKKLRLITKKDSNLKNELTVIHDDLDIKLGNYKIADNSRSAGHNGVQSIIDQIKTKNFIRYRIGIMGDKPKAMPSKKYVLQKFSKEELDILDPITAEIATNIKKA